MSCKGNFENFLSQGKYMLRKMKARFLGITSVLPLIAKVDLPLLVTYQHDTQKYPPITLHETGETINTASWYDKLAEYRSVRTPIYRLVYIGLT